MTDNEYEVAKAAKLKELQERANSIARQIMGMQRNLNEVLDEIADLKLDINRAHSSRLRGPGI